LEKTLRITAIILLTLLGVSAIGGGISLLLDSSGTSMGLPIDLLEKTPFSSYATPGLILLVFNGISSFGVGIATSINNKWHPWLIILQGFILIGWLSVQLYLNTDFFYPLLHFPFYAVGIALVGIGMKLTKI